MNRPGGKDVFPWHEWLPHTCEFSLEETSRQYFAVKSVLHLDDKDKPNLFVTCRFHRKVPIYAAGESVSGTVYAFVDDAFPCKSVNIHLRGVCFVDLPPSHPRGSKCIDVLHVDVFNSWAADAPDEGRIDSGISKFKFSLQIPEKARATTLDSCVSVLYCILVEFVPPDNHEYKKIMAFGGYVKIRSRPYVEEQILNSQNSCTEVLEVFGKDGVLKGKLNVDVQLPAQGAVFNTGQKVSIDVKITQQYFNGCYKLEEIFPVLVQNIVFQSDPSVEFSRVLSPFDQCRNVTLRKKLRALTYKFTLSVGDIMPSTQPSIDQNDLLSVSYHLQLLVKHELKDTYYSLCGRPVAVVDDLNICTDMDGNESYLSFQADDDVSSEEESEALMNAFDACYVSGKYGPEEEGEIPRYYASVRQLLTVSSEFMIDFISRYSFLDLVDKKQPAWRKSPRARVEAEKEAEEFKKAVEKAKKVNDFVEMGVKSTLRVMTKWKCRKYVTRQDSKEFRLFLKQNVLKIIEFKKWLLSEIDTYSPLAGSSSEHFPCTSCLRNGLESETSKDLAQSAPKKGERASLALRKSRLISKISKKDIVQPSLTPSHCCQTLNELVRYVWFDEKETPISSSNPSPSFRAPFAVVSIFPSTIKSDLSHGVLFKYPTGLKKHSSSSNVSATANGSVTEDDISGSPTETPTNLARSPPCENMCAPSGLVALNVIDNKIIRKIYMTQHIWHVIQSNAVINFTIAHSNISDGLTNTTTFTRDELVRQKKHDKKPPEKPVTDRNLIPKTRIKDIKKSETMDTFKKVVFPTRKNEASPEENAPGEAKQEPVSSKHSTAACMLDGIGGRSDYRLREDDCNTTAHVVTCQSNSQHNDCKRVFHKNGSPPVSKEKSPGAQESDSSSSDTGSIDEPDITTYSYFTWSQGISRDNKICGSKSSDSEISDSQKVSLDLDLNVSGKKVAKNLTEATLSAKHVADGGTEIRNNAVMKAKNSKVSSTINSKDTKSKFRPLIGVESNKKPTKSKTCKNNQEMKSGHLNDLLCSIQLTSREYDASDESTTERSFFSSSGSQKCRRIYSDSWSIPSRTRSESVGKSPISFHPYSSINETGEKKQLNTENDTEASTENDTENHTDNDTETNTEINTENDTETNPEKDTETNTEKDTETNTAPAKTKLTTVHGKTNPVGQRLLQLKTNSADQKDKKERAKISDRFLAMQGRSGKQLAKHKRQTKALAYETIDTSVADKDIKSNRILKKEHTIHEVENSPNSRCDISQAMHTKVDLSMVHKYSTKIFFEGPTSDGKLPKLAVVARAKPMLPEDEHFQNGVHEPAVIRPETGRRRSPRSMQKSHLLDCNFHEASLVKLSEEISTHENKDAKPNRVPLEKSRNATDSQNMDVNPDRTSEEMDPKVDNQSNDLLVAVNSCANIPSNGRLTPQSGTCTVLEIWYNEVEKMFDPLSSDSPPISYAVPRTVDSEGPFRVTRFEKEREKLWEVNVIGNMDLQHTGIWSHKPLNAWATMKYGDAATVFSVPNFERHRIWRNGPWRSKLNPRAPSFAGLLSANQKIQKLPPLAQPNIILPIGDDAHPDDTNLISANYHVYPQS